MSSDFKLPDLEKTLVEMIVELLLIEKEKRYDHLIYGSPETKESVRITMHYVMALLAYGFSPDDPELNRAEAWFNTSFTRRMPTINTIEMNRLMVLLHIRPDSPHISPRLRQLTMQRSGDFYDVQPAWHEFDTLWTLEAFICAHQVGVLPDDLIALDDVKARLDRIISEKELRRHKDIALALRLYYELCGQLEPAHMAALDDLLGLAERSGGMWGMAEFLWLLERMPWYQQFRDGRMLMYEDITEHMLRFRKIIVSSCMIVENLSPLIPDYPHLRQPLERALSMWWRQFSGENATARLRSLFSKQHDYDYLLVLSRTLRAVRGYLNRPLQEFSSLAMLRELAHLRADNTDALDIHNIKEAMRRWVHFDLAEPPEKLTLGFSDASVVRVKPHVWSPLSNPDERAESLLRRTLIIKYGPTEEIRKERENYEKLPASAQEYFVRIPEPSYTDPAHGLSYVVMQDLHDYQTLYESLHLIEENPTRLADRLGNFLTRMHEGGSSQVSPAPQNLFRQLYLGRTLEHIDRVFDFILEHASPVQMQEMREAQHSIFDQLAEIIRHQRTLEAFPRAYMHGDLHMRNIMVATQPRPPALARDLSFKLIDLEFTRNDGDPAFDIGQLMMDITVVAREARAHNAEPMLLRLRDSLERAYQRFSHGRDDSYFGLRVELAKARALLRIAKGKVKRGQKYAEHDNRQLLSQLCDELVTDVNNTIIYLQAVVSALKS